MDKHPRGHESTWPALCRALEVDRMPGHHPQGADPKKYLPGLLGATFSPSVRAARNVVSLQLALFDFDNAESIPDPTGAVHPSGRPVMVKRQIAHPAVMGHVCEELERRGIAAYAYSTWSSSPEAPRFRIVIPLAMTVVPDLWPRLVAWLMDRTGIARWREAIDLPCTLDTARLNFLPARRPEGTPVEQYRVEGKVLVLPSADVLSAHEVARVELQPWQREALAKRGVSCPVTSSDRCSWARRFRSSDGRPLDLRTLDAVHLLEVLGCRVGPGRAWGSGVKHRTSCPWPQEHSHDLDDDSAALFLTPGRWPEWRCSHSHHAHLSLVDLLEAAGVLRDQA